MKMKAVLTVAFVALAIIGMSIARNSTTAQGARSATLTNIKGTVMVKKAGTGQWVAATDRMALNQGDELKTQGGSSAIIKMDDGSMMKIGPLAITKMSQLGRSGRDNKTNIGVDIGKTWNRVNRLSGDAKFDVTTPTAVAGVRGTYFSSEVAQTADSAFDVFDGSVEVASAKNPSQAVMVGANQRTTVAPGQTPAAPSTIPSKDLESSKSGFSDAEVTMAVYDMQISVSPQTLQPGQNATVSVQIFKNGQPANQAASVKLKLSGAAKFVDNGAGEMEVTTNDSGAATVSITSSEKETVTVSAELRIKVAK